MSYDDIEPIAIVGMSLRVPGARTIDDFWRNICRKAESITWFNPAQLETAGVPSSLYNDPAYVPAAAVLADADHFDAELFGVSRSEATMLDPQHRLFLECTWAALEDSGYDPQRFEGTIGLYGGCFMNRYLFNLYTNEEFSRSPSVHYAWRYNDKDFLTGQTAYLLNLRGPAVTVQTACSTSLVATHLACQSLLSRDCDIALAGGVSVRVPLSAGYLAPEGAMFSPEGRCRPFDAAARGTVPGDGCAIVALRRMSDAIADGDNIRAIIRATAINNDGRNKVSFTAPSPEGQMQVIIAAQTLGAVHPDGIGYIEAHGTGTRLGDPIEVSALTDAFRLRTKRRNFCALGSLKANIGHLDAAAGTAGLVRALLALERKCIPPQANFVEANPALKLETSPFYVPTEPSEWRTGETPRRAAVSAFAVGGTNAHVILEEAPPRGPAKARRRPHQLFVFSGRNSNATDAIAVQLGEHLAQRPDQDLAGVAFTLAEGRSTLAARRFVVAADGPSAARALREPAQAVVAEDLKPWVVFMFPGVGTQYPDMALDIYEAEPEFRKQVDLCASLLLDRLGLDVRHYLFPSRHPGRGADRESVPNVLAAIFAVEYALGKLWLSWGVKPDAMLGHSLGEYVAACMAGVLTLPDALDLSVRRGQIFDHIPDGRMLSVPLPASEISPLLGDRLSLGAVNAPKLCLVSGLNVDLEALSDRLSARGVECRVLPVRMASHSYLVDPYLDGFMRTVAEYKLSPPQIPYLSCCTGDWIKAEEATNPSYWARQLRSPVQFESMARTVLSHPGAVLLEVGPGNTLCTLAGAQRSAPRANAIPSLRHPREPRTDFESLLAAAGRLWQSGAALDWKAVTAIEAPGRESLPTYPFQRKRYWISRGRAIGPGSAGDTSTGASEHAPPPASEQVSLVEQAVHAHWSERERTIAEIWRRHLGRDDIGLDDNFESIGGHSLLAAQMLPQLRALSESPLKVTDFFGAPTIRKLAALIDTAGVRPVVDLAAEVVLDPAIRPAGLLAAVRGPASAVLLTGATGFLGTFLLSELLQQTSATVYCLVRARNAEEGEGRLQQRLAAYHLPAASPGRIVAVPGDLEKPRLGVPAADYEALAGRLETIYHCGARVNFVRPYLVLKAANVLGTEEILRLATRHRLKTVHYVSTLFVNMGAITAGAKFVNEGDPLPPPIGHASSYTETKWVAESLCRLAAARGVPVAIYRPGNILSDRRTGVSNPEDFFTRFAQGCVDLGVVPRRRAAYPVGTVDDVARMVVLFSLQEHAIGRTFHLIHPEMMEWEEMFGHLNEYGYDAPVVSWEEWRAIFDRKVAAGSDNALLPLTDMIANLKVDNIDWPRFGVDNAKSFRERLGIPYPVLDRNYFSMMYKYMADNRLLPSPNRDSRPSGVISGTAVNLAARQADSTKCEKSGASGSNLTLSDYDQSLGVGTPTLYRMFCLTEMPNIDQLVFALGKTLQHFPRFATRIVLTDNGHAKLVALEAPVSLELRPPARWVPEDFRREDVPLFVRGLTTEAEKPVLAVTLTPVTNGAVLGVSWSHAVGDMYSYYLFHAYWNEQMRLATSLDAAHVQRVARSAIVSAASPRSWVKDSHAGEGRARSNQNYWEIIGFERDELEALRADLEKDGTVPSLNEALTAYIVHRFGFKLMGRRSGLRLRVPVNVRGAHPLVPEDYIGNAIIEALIPLDELADTPAAARTTAHRIRETLRVARMPQNIASAIAVDERGIRLLKNDLPVYDRNIDILSTNLSKMPFHKLGFGGGTPVRVFGWTYNGVRIVATETGLAAHIFS